MVARLQQVIVFAWFGSLLGWMAFWWHRSLLATCLGVAALLTVHAAVLAIEFGFARHVNRRDSTTPPPSLPQMLRAWLAESVIAPRVFCWYQPFRRNAIPDALHCDRRRGAVLIHGFLCNRGFWQPWLHELEHRKRVFVALTLEPVFGSIDHYVDEIDRAIGRVATATGQAPLLISHSMGGLAARAWLRDAIDPSRVHRIVTLGTPHAGTSIAHVGQSVNGRQMRPGGDWLANMTPRAGEAQRAPFTCWYSNCDNIVFPASSATLAGADNRLAGGLAHVQLAFDATVMQQTLALLDADDRDARVRDEQAISASDPLPVETRRQPAPSAATGRRRP